MIDTHCHLTDPRLHAQLADVLRRAKDADVKQMITIGTSVADSRSALELASRFDNVRCAAGIHPNHAVEVKDLKADLEAIRTMSADEKVLAIGETGLDYHYDVDRVAQRRVFEAQVKLSEELNKPLIIHCREAVDDCLEMMRGVRSDGAVFHCFTGSAPDAEKIVAAGFWIGFTGAVTFNKNESLRKAAAIVPRDRLLIETDSPYLSPEPIRKQKTNEPSFVVHVAATIASIWNVDVSEVDRVTTSNAHRLFAFQ